MFILFNMLLLRNEVNLYVKRGKIVVIYFKMEISVVSGEIVYIMWFYFYLNYVLIYLEKKFYVK